jgi:hypothetical protein
MYIYSISNEDGCIAKLRERWMSKLRMVDGG